MSANRKIHKLEFRDAPEVFDGSTVTYEDDRFNYGEQRFVTLGLLKGTAVSIVHTETPEQSALSLLERRHDMKKRTSSKVSKTDWKRLRAMKEHQIKLSKAHAQLDITHVARTLVRKGLQPVPPKTSLALRVDADVVEWFKAQGRGYQTRMNAVLRAFKEASI